ncbi:hypothetical protein [Amycolatopsis pigmentata]|uniref:Uncharacterized protein n=1 Tax=Amycolatopsis pigmentata TaxID=450801 RepID=A0ABW5FNU7_9PSEU
MTPPHDNTPPDRAADLDAARLLLTRMGITAHDLINQPVPRTPLPTFAEYIPVVSDAVSEGTRRVYTSYWNRINEHWGHRRLDEPTPSQIKHLVEHVRTNVVARRNARGGAQANTSSPPSAASTATPKTTASSHPPTTPPAKSPNPHDCPPHDAPSPTTGSPRSTTPRPPPATTRPSTPSYCDCTPKPRAAAAAHSPYGHRTSTPPNA